MPEIMTKRSGTFMPRSLPKLVDRIDKIKDSAVRNALNAGRKYLTDLAIRNIVDYILELEDKNG